MAVMLKPNPKTNMLTFITARSSPAAFFEMWRKEREKERKRKRKKAVIEVICFISLCQTEIHRRKEVKWKTAIYIKVKKFQSWDWQKAGNRQNIYGDGRDGGVTVAVSANWRWWLWGDCRTAEGKQSLGCLAVGTFKSWKPHTSKGFYSLFSYSDFFFPKSKTRTLSFSKRRKQCVLYAVVFFFFFSSWGDKIILNTVLQGKQ